jgi:IclR family KDG regulon transcriptional repressor
MALSVSRREQTTKAAAGGDGAFVVRALAKGLAILALFDAENREWTLDEIAERAGLPRMTAYRMIRTMESAWFLVRDPVTNRYHLGPALLASTYLSEGYAELAAIVRPYLQGLAEATGEAATLAIEVDGVSVSVDMVDTPRPFRREVAVGRIIGDTASANGKIFAAFKSPAERETIIAQTHEQLTANTITDPQVLARELELAASEGVAFDIEERNIGTCAVAAPVRDQLGKVVAALSVIAPTGRFGPAEKKSHAEAVKASAVALSGFLGYSQRG